MKTSMFAALLLASTFIAGGAAAQPAPFQDFSIGVGAIIGQPERHLVADHGNTSRATQAAEACRANLKVDAAGEGKRIACAACDQLSK